MSTNENLNLIKENKFTGTAVVQTNSIITPDVVKTGVVVNTNGKLDPIQILEETSN